MPDEDKQKKKEDIEKLRMILDNPEDPQSFSKDDKCLDSVRRRLGRKSYSTQTLKTGSRSTSTDSDFLQPQVTIHGPYEKPVAPKQEPSKEPALKPPVCEEKKPKQEVLTQITDLYDIERIEDNKTDIPEWKPVVESGEKQIPVEATTAHLEQASKTTSEQELPEWTPVAVISAEPKRSPEKPKSTEEQTDQNISHIVQDRQLDVFKDLHSVDSPTAALLVKKGFNSVENLRESSIETLEKSGINKKVARSIKREIAQIEKKKAKQLKKAARVSVSVKTVQMTQPAAEWTVAEQQSEKTLPEIQEKEKTSEETLPVWESVPFEERQQTQMSRKKPLRLLKKRSPKQAEPVSGNEAGEEQKPVPEKKTTQMKEAPKHKSIQEKKPSKPKQKKKQLAEKKKPVQTSESEKKSIFFKRREKKEVTITETRVQKSDEWVRKPKQATVKKPKIKKILGSEWEKPAHAEETPKLESKKDDVYQFGEYTLYKKEIKTADGKLRTIHFFSKTKLTNSSPSTLPEGCEVVVNEKTGLPFLKKKTS